MNNRKIISNQKIEKYFNAERPDELPTVELRKFYKFFLETSLVKELSKNNLEKTVTVDSLYAEIKNLIEANKLDSDEVFCILKLSLSINGFYKLHESIYEATRTTIRELDAIKMGDLICSVLEARKRDSILKGDGFCEKVLSACTLEALKKALTYFNESKNVKTNHVPSLEARKEVLNKWIESKEPTNNTSLRSASLRSERLPANLNPTNPNLTPSIGNSNANSSHDREIIVLASNESEEVENDIENEEIVTPTNVEVEMEVDREEIMASTEIEKFSKIFNNFLIKKSEGEDLDLDDLIKAGLNIDNLKKEISAITIDDLKKAVSALDSENALRIFELIVQISDDGNFHYKMYLSIKDKIDFANLPESKLKSLSLQILVNNNNSFEDPENTFIHKFLNEVKRFDILKTLQEELGNLQNIAELENKEIDLNEMLKEYSKNTQFQSTSGKQTNQTETRITQTEGDDNNDDNDIVTENATPSRKRKDLEENERAKRKEPPKKKLKSNFSSDPVEIQGVAPVTTSRIGAVMPHPLSYHPVVAISKSCDVLPYSVAPVRNSRISGVVLPTNTVSHPSAPVSNSRISGVVMPTNIVPNPSAPMSNSRMGDVRFNAMPNPGAPMSNGGMMFNAIPNRGAPMSNVVMFNAMPNRGAPMSNGGMMFNAMPNRGAPMNNGGMMFNAMPNRGAPMNNGGMMFNAMPNRGAPMRNVVMFNNAMPNPNQAHVVPSTDTSSFYVMVPLTLFQQLNASPNPPLNNTGSSRPSNNNNPV